MQIAWVSVEVELPLDCDLLSHIYQILDSVVWSRPPDMSANCVRRAFDVVDFLA